MGLFAGAQSHLARLCSLDCCIGLHAAAREAIQHAVGWQACCGLYHLQTCNHEQSIGGHIWFALSLIMSVLPWHACAHAD